MAVQLYALSGVARSGATRSNYTTPKPFISIAGVEYGTGRVTDSQKVDYGSLTVTDLMTSTPNTCSFVARGFDPQEGQEVLVRLGSKNNGQRVFGGIVLNRDHHYQVAPGQYGCQVNCIDYTWHLTRQLVRATYTSISATTIAQAVIALVPGMSSAGVAANLAAVSVTWTDITVDAAMQQLAALVGGYYYVDYNKVVHLYTSDTSVTNPTDLTSAHPTLMALRHQHDLSQIVTRVRVSGSSARAYAGVSAGATSLGVTDVTPFASSGYALVDGMRISYSSISGAFSAPNLNSWTTQSAPPAVYKHAIWVSTLGYFVAVGNGAGATSVDGITWTARTMPAGQHHRVAWSSTLGLLAASNDSGTISTSPDGITWTTRSPAEANQWYGICWSSTLGMFCAVAYNGTHQVATSTNGTTWSLATAAAVQNWGAVVWADGPNVFAAVATTGAGTSVMTSADGVTWTGRTGYYSMVDVAWNGSLLVAVGGSPDRIATSPDGVTWTTRTSPSAVTWNTVIWASELSLWIAMSQTSTAVMSSSDGITWTAATCSQTALWESVVWSPTAGRIVGLGQTAGTPKLSTNDTTLLYRTLAGIPASGQYSLSAAVAANDTITYEAQVDDLTAQAALAALIGGSDTGVVEEVLAAGAVTSTAAIAYGTAELTLRKNALVTVTYTSRDPNTYSGRTVTVSLASPTSLSGTFMIQRVTVSAFQPALFPTYSVTAVSTLYRIEDVLRQLTSL